MLRRIRIEVEANSTTQVVEELDKYEHALQTAEAERFGLGYAYNDYVINFSNWAMTIEDRDFYNEKLGRQVTEEVIEWDNTLPGYRGRRVVRYERLDSREVGQHAQPPAV